MADLRNLAKSLEGQTLAEAFDKIIGDEPEIKALAKNAIHASPGNPFFPDSPGNPYLPDLEKRSYGEMASEWPVLTANLRIMEGPWGLLLSPDATEADAKFMKGLADRYDLMMEPLRSGYLVGSGHLADGKLEIINKGIWSSDSYLIDFVHSDVGKISEIEGFETYSRFTPVWSAVELVLPSEVTGEKDTATNSPDETKLTRAEVAIAEVVRALYPKGKPVGLKSKERENKIIDEIEKRGGSRYESRTIRRYFEKVGEESGP